MASEYNNDPPVREGAHRGIKIDRANSLKPVLRLSNSIRPTDLSPKMIAALAKTAGLSKSLTLDDFEVKHFSDETQATIHLIRIKSLSAGVKFLVESRVLRVARGMQAQAFNQEVDKLIESAGEELRRYKTNSSADRVACQNILAEYKKAAKELMRNWLLRADNTPLLDETVLDKYMDQAEKFAVLKQGRAPLLTMQKNNKPKTAADVSRNRPLVNGLIFLIESGDLLVAPPETKATIIEDIKKRLGEDRNSLRLFMGAHLQKPGRIPLQLDDEIYEILDHGAEKFAAYMATPEYTVQSEVPQVALTIHLVKEYFLVAQYLYHQSKGTLSQFADIDKTNRLAWFKKLNDSQRKMLWHVLKSSSDGVPDMSEIADKIRTIPSELRIVPGMANHSLHKLIEIDEKDAVHTVSTELRSSMIASRDLAMTATGARSEHVLHSAMVVIENGINHILKDHVKKMLHENMIKKGDSITVPFLMQTLTSPLMMAAFFMPDYNLHVDKQLAMEAMQKLLAKESIVIAGVKVKIELIDTNHPQNTLGRAADPTTPQGQNGQQGLKLAAMAMDHVFNLRAKAVRFVEEADALLGEIVTKKVVGKARDDKFNQIKKLKKDLDGLLQQANALESAARELHQTINNRPVLDLAERFITGNIRHNRELYIASLEQVVTQKMGGVDYGSCVSGKDRKALELLHTDAMLIYHRRYKKWPGYKTEDANFAEIFAELFCSRHQQNNACQNMPGSCGIKHPEDYLPKYIIHAVENRLQALKLGTLHDEERRATNNKVPSIKAEKNKSRSIVKAALQLLFVNIIGGAVALVLGAVGGVFSRAFDFAKSLLKTDDQNKQFEIARDRVDNQQVDVANELSRKQAIVEAVRKTKSSNGPIHNSEVGVVSAMHMPPTSIVPSAPVVPLPVVQPLADAATQTESVSPVMSPRDLSHVHGR